MPREKISDDGAAAVVGESGKLSSGLEKIPPFIVEGGDGVVALLKLLSPLACPPGPASLPARVPPSCDSRKPQLLCHGGILRCTWLRSQSLISTSVLCLGGPSGRRQGSAYCVHFVGCLV